MSTILQPPELLPVDTADAPAPREPTVLSARFLGGFWVTVDHVEVPLGTSRRTRALLAYLVDRGRPIPRDVLMEVFWPSATVEAARNSLHVALCSVRKALAQAWAGTVIERRGDTYRLADGLEVWTDVAELERRVEQAAATAAAGRLDEAVGDYEAALSLYGGEFLADDPYLEWAMDRREDLRLQAIDCAEHLSELYLALGDVSRALVVASRLLREEPCHEPVARRVMVAYARLGQPHMALRQFDRIVEVLGRELGVAPAPETVALADDIRRRRPV